MSASEALTVHYINMGLPQRWALNGWFTNIRHFSASFMWRNAMATPVSFRILIAGALLGVSSLSAIAESTIAVEINQAKILKLSRPADTVVIGNPDIADAAVQDSTTIVLTGKGFGQTNVVVLAEDGTPIVDQEVSVSRNAASTVRIYRRAEIQTLYCAPFCESAFKSAAEQKSEEEQNQAQ